MQVRRSALFLFTSLASVATCSTLCPRAQAQASPADTATAQALFDQAKKLMAEGKYGDACPKLEESQRLDPGTGTLLNLGDCYEHIGKFATAWGKFLEAAAVAKSAKQVERERVSRQRAAALLPRVSNFVISVAAGDTPGLEVKRDGATIGKAQWGTPLPADPGEHKISASAAGKSAWESTVVVGPGETKTIAVPALSAASRVGATEPSAPSAEASVKGALPPLAPSPATDSATSGSGQKWLGLAVGGTGLVAMGIGGIIALGAKAKYDEADCNGNVCQQVGFDDRQSAISSAKTATIVSGIGAAALAGGVILWLTAPSGRAPVAVRVHPLAQSGSSFTGAGLSVRGAW